MLTGNGKGARARRAFMLTRSPVLVPGFLDEFPIGVSRGETPRATGHRFLLDVARMRRKAGTGTPSEFESRGVRC